MANFLSNNLHILSLLGALLGVVAASYSFLQTYRRQRAETHFVRILVPKGEEPESLRRLYRLQELRRRQIISDSEFNHEQSELLRQALDELTQSFSVELENLDEDDRERVEEALYQPSLQGRINYIRKLLGEIEENSQNLKQQTGT
jgi:hypothetical protein